MRKIILLIIIAFICSCKPRENSPIGEILSGNHNLRRMVAKEQIINHVNSNFFLFLGGYSKDTNNNLFVQFAWKMNNDTYAFSKLPLSKIRVKIDNTIKDPYVKFRWHGGRLRNLKDIINYNVIYVLIVCDESKWPEKIDIDF